MPTDFLSSDPESNIEPSSDQESALTQLDEISILVSGTANAFGNRTGLQAHPVCPSYELPKT